MHSALVRSLFFAVQLLAAAAAAGNAGYAQNNPVAGSGKLPELDPFAGAPQNVTDAVATMLSNRAERSPFSAIKGCFKNAGLNEIAQIECRQRFDRYFAHVREKRRDLLGPLPPLEVYARLASLSGDPQGVRFAKDVYGLRGLINNLDDARGFAEVKKCFQQAGPQPAIRQICRQNFDRFHTELMTKNALLFRDLDPEVIRKRLFAVADEGNSIFGVGETTAFESLRNIRKAQQEE